MGGDDSQKLLSWRGSTPLQGANLRLYYEINNVTDTALGNLARGTPSFCRSGRGLSSDHGSLLESRGGSLLARAEGKFLGYDRKWPKLLQNYTEMVNIFLLVGFESPVTHLNRGR